MIYVECKELLPVISDYKHIFAIYSKDTNGNKSFVPGLIAKLIHFMYFKQPRYGTYIYWGIWK